MAPTPNTISSAEKVSDIQDLLNEILIRVPTKPVTRFKVVSKTWRRLISSPKFSSSHAVVHFSTNPSAFFVRRSRTRFQFISLSKPTAINPLDSINLSCLKIIQSCNGLVLLSSILPALNTTRLVHHVSNPATKQLTTLPYHHTPEFVEISLAFDPRRSANYKVIGISKLAVVDGSLSQHQLHVYSSKTKKWRALGFVPKLKMVSRQSVYCNGAVYWIAHDGEGLRFDIDQECLTIIPRFEKANKRRKHLYESNGHLQLFQTSYTWCMVMELESDYSGWFIKHWINPFLMVFSLPELVTNGDRSLFTFLYIVEGDDEDKGPTMLFHMPGKVVSYDTKSGDFRIVCDLSGGSGEGRKRRTLQFGWHVHPYVESLAPV